MSRRTDSLCLDEYLSRLISFYFLSYKINTAINFSELKKRTHILECAWNQEHDDDEEEEEVKVDQGSEETTSSHDIYGDVGKRAPNEFEKVLSFPNSFLNM